MEACKGEMGRLSSIHMVAISHQWYLSDLQLPSEGCKKQKHTITEEGKGHQDLSPCSAQ